MNEEWKQIREYYERALYALRCPRHLNGQKQWSRNQQTGRYYLWKAYQAARESTIPDHLIFTRILALMADEHRRFPSEYGRLRYYVKPAYEQYRLAVAEGQSASAQELEFIEWL